MAEERTQYDAKVARIKQVVKEHIASLLGEKEQLQAQLEQYEQGCACAIAHSDLSFLPLRSSQPLLPRPFAR